MVAFPCSQAGLLAWMLLLLLLSSSEVQSECQTPVLPPHSSLRGGGDLAQSYPIGTVLRLQCDPGYIPKSGAIRSMTCLDINKWSELPTLCERRRCTTPYINFGNIESTDGFWLGDEVTFFCNYGYLLIGSPNVRCVLKYGKVDWDRRFPYCKSIFCTSPPVIANGYYDGGSSGEYSVFSAVTYRCNAGYSLIGQSTIACTIAENGSDGMWDSSPPECKKVECLRPNIPNGRMPYGSRATYTYQNSIYIECSPGYNLVGSSTIHCDANSKWNPPVPQCVKN